jgi:hypothetical protein
MKKFTLLFFIFHFSFFTFHLSEAQILRVPAEYPTIQQGVDAAGYGDTVLVAPGTYLENILIQGNDKVLTLASNFILSGDTNDINNTIIDASQPQNPNYGMGILLKNQDTTLMPKITGFTITGGTGYYKTYGGGIYSSNAIPVIEYNHIQDCSITGTQPNGGGIYIGGINPNTICVISHNVIKNCTVTSAVNGVEANGAGMALNNVKAIIEDNKITDNTTLGNSTCNCLGGGIYYYCNIPIDYAPQLNIINNEISNNAIQSWHAEGGGIQLYGYVQYIIEGNIISHNQAGAIGSSGYALGGGMNIYNVAEGSVISSNIISDNSVLDGPAGSDRSGGGIYVAHIISPLTEIFPLIEKNRITGNTAYNGAGIACVKAGAKIVNNFISGNQAEAYGGAIYFNGPAATTLVTEVINNTVTDNSVSGQDGKAGSIYFNGNMTVMMMNNLFYGNQAETSDEIWINISEVQMHNCDINTGEITGIWTGENNFYADPQFIDEMAWDCWTTDAACSNTGIDQIFAYNQWFTRPSVDILDNARPQDEFVDIGAREVDMCFVGVPEVSCQRSKVSSYPNPTGGIVDFRFSIFDAGRVTLKVFDVQGREMAVVLDEDKMAGELTIRWNADRMPAGVYYYSLRTGKQTETGKIIIL